MTVKKVIITLTNHNKEQLKRAMIPIIIIPNDYHNHSPISWSILAISQDPKLVATQASWIIIKNIAKTITSQPRPYFQIDS